MSRGFAFGALWSKIRALLKPAARRRGLRENCCNKTGDFQTFINSATFIKRVTMVLTSLLDRTVKRLVDSVLNTQFSHCHSVEMLLLWACSANTTLARVWMAPILRCCLNFLLLFAFDQLILCRLHSYSVNIPHRRAVSRSSDFFVCAINHCESFKRFSIIFQIGTRASNLTCPVSKT